MNKRRETLWRLLRLLVSQYKGWLFISLVAIILSALSGVAGSLFIQRLIDRCLRLASWQSFSTLALLRP